MEKEEQGSGAKAFGRDSELREKKKIVKLKLVVVQKEAEIVLLKNPLAKTATR